MEENIREEKPTLAEYKAFWANINIQGNYEQFARKFTKSKSPNSVSDESYTKMVTNDNELKRKQQMEKCKKQSDKPSDIIDKSLKNISKKIDNSNNKVKSQTSKLPTERIYETRRKENIVFAKMKLHKEKSEQKFVYKLGENLKIKNLDEEILQKKKKKAEEKKLLLRTFTVLSATHFGDDLKSINVAMKEHQNQTSTRCSNPSKFNRSFLDLQRKNKSSELELIISSVKDQSVIKSEDQKKPTTNKEQIKNSPEKKQKSDDEKATASNMSVYLGINQQPQPSIITSIVARPILPNVKHVPENFPYRCARWLPRGNSVDEESGEEERKFVDKSRSYNLPDYEPQTKSQTRRFMRSPTLGEIALRRKLTDRLPTRKVQKRWPEARDFSFDLNIEPKIKKSQPNGLFEEYPRILRQRKKMKSVDDKLMRSRDFRALSLDLGLDDQAGILTAREMSIYSNHRVRLPKLVPSCYDGNQPPQPSNTPNNDDKSLLLPRVVICDPRNKPKKDHSCEISS